MILVSFDIERDMYRYAFESAESQTASEFLEACLEIFDKSNVGATFFVQARMVQSLSPILRQLAKKQHMIGLHGYLHELWGKNNWITRRPPITLVERETRLRESVEIFRTAGLSRPTAFRAPNFTIDKTTYKMLRQYEFTIDSSVPSQRGNLYTPKVVEGITVIPVTTAPIADFYRNPHFGFTTAARFYQLNFDVFMKTSPEKLVELVRDIIRFQVSQQIPPYIMMYAHNWEFETVGFRTGLLQLTERVNMLIQTFRMSTGTAVDFQQRLLHNPKGT